MFGFGKKKKLEKELKSKKATDAEKAIDDYLINSLKESQRVNRFADKVVKARVLRSEIDKTLNKIRDLADEDDEEDEEEEEEESDEIGQQVFKNIIMPMIQKAKNPNGPLNYEFEDSDMTPLKIKLLEKLKSLSDDDLVKVINKLNS